MISLPSTMGRGALILVMVWGLFAGPLQAAEQAVQPIQQFQQALIHIMKHGKRLGFEGRKQYLAPIIDQSFDFAHISRAIIGRYWGQLNASERQGLADRIREYALATLASRFTVHEGQTFTLGGQEPTSDTTQRIKSHFSGPDTDVALDYIVRRDGRNNWRISNVWFNGVSGTDIQHKEFASFLRKGGADQLIAKLDEIISFLGQES